MNNVSVALPLIDGEGTHRGRTFEGTSINVREEGDGSLRVTGIERDGKTGFALFARGEWCSATLMREVAPSSAPDPAAPLEVDQAAFLGKP